MQSQGDIPAADFPRFTLTLEGDILHAERPAFLARRRDGSARPSVLIWFEQPADDEEREAMIADCADWLRAVAAAPSEARWN